MKDIGLKNIKKSYGIYEVLKNVSFDIMTGDKVALIGANGSGKTTLFKLISKRVPFEEGDLTIRKGIKVNCLDQISDYPEYFTAEDVINSAFAKVLKLKEELEAYDQKLALGTLEGMELEKLLEKYGKIQSDFENLGGYEIDTLKEKMCHGLQIDEAFLTKEFKVLSGGEQTTVNLAKILLENPEVLLLDEPSNHLDIKALEWLEEYLKNYAGSVVIVSHDRYFIDRAVNKIIELEDGECSVFHGNYTYYKEEKERRLMQEFAEYTDQQKKVKAMKEAAKRFRIWARGDHEKFFRKAKEMERRISKIEMLDRPKLDRKKIGLNFGNSNRSGRNVVTCKGLAKSFDEKTLFENLDLQIYYREKAAILGSNGCGKSTLIKMILKKIEADSGNAELGAGVKAAYLDQNIQFEDHNITVLETYRNFCSCFEHTARNELANFLFYRDDVFKLVKDLSGGEKTRLKLALLMKTDTNLLVLDEPTNHLDIDSKEMLEDALEGFGGTILFVSHDRYFINKIANRIVELREKEIFNYEGNYDFYKEELAKKVKIETMVEEKNKVKVQPKSKPKTKEKDENKQYVIEINMDDLESKIDRIELEIKELNKTISSNGTDYELIADTYEKIRLLEEKRDELYEMIA